MPFSRRGRLAKTVLAVTATVTLLATGCSSDDGTTASARPVTTSSSATIAPSETPAPSTTQPSAAGADLTKGPPYERTVGPSGSGCAPPAGASLPSGWWAGRVKSVNGASFDFDLVCWFSGQAAIKAGNDDGAGPVEDDYYVRDTGPKLFQEAFVSADAPATCVGDDDRPFPCRVSDVLGLYASRQLTGKVNGRQVTAFSTVWLHVTGDRPDYLYMQFTP